MNSGGTFNWPDGDVILRATHGAETSDFRVHKLFLSFSTFGNAGADGVQGLLGRSIFENVELEFLNCLRDLIRGLRWVP